MRHIPQIEKAYTVDMYCNLQQAMSRFLVISQKIGFKVRKANKTTLVTYLSFLYLDKKSPVVFLSSQPCLLEPEDN